MWCVFMGHQLHIYEHIVKNIVLFVLIDQNRSLDIGLKLLKWIKRGGFKRD